MTRIRKSSQHYSGELKPVTYPRLRISTSSLPYSDGKRINANKRMRLKIVTCSEAKRQEQCIGSVVMGDRWRRRVFDDLPTLLLGYFNASFYLLVIELNFSYVGCLSMVTVYKCSVFVVVINFALLRYLLVLPDVS